MHVIAHILTWNDRRYLPELFASLEAQTYKDMTIRMLDNGSTDGETLQYLQEHAAHALVARNVRNQGFSPGHNQLMRFTFEHMTEDELDNTAIVVMNADMILDPDVMKTMVEVLESHPDIAAVQPKIYRAYAEHIGDEALEETVKSDILDTTGLRVSSGWRMSDRGAGELDQGQFDNATDVFGPTGTCTLFRARAVRNVLVDGEFYDGDFHTYREDCDLAWRMRAAGMKTVFAPSAKAWHYRGMFGAEKMSWLQRLRNRQGQRPFFAALSTRNQIFVLLKNLSWGEAARSLPAIVFHEGGRIAYGLLFERQTRKVLVSAPTLIPRMLRKRRIVRALATEPGAVLRSYVS